MVGKALSAHAGYGYLPDGCWATAVLASGTWDHEPQSHSSVGSDFPQNMLIDEATC